MLLELKNLDAGYGFLQVVWDVSLSVAKGEYVCLLGSNGAGKSTTLKTIAGIVPPKRGEVIFEGKSIVGLPGNSVCRKGISYISEELNLFTGMSVQENLALGAYSVKDKRTKKDHLDSVFELFPKLRERRNQLAGTMSGGEQKQLAIARGLMSDPSFLLIDEPSLGLAPLVITEVFKTLKVLKEKGVTILLVEQNVRKALRMTDRGYILEKGRIVLEGISSVLAETNYVRKVYLGA